MLIGRHLYRIYMPNQASLVLLVDSILVCDWTEWHRLSASQQADRSTVQGHTVMMEMSEGGASSQAVK